MSQAGNSNIGWEDFLERFFLLLALDRLSNTGSQRKWCVRKLRETTSGENSRGHNKTPKTRNRNEKTKQNCSSFSYFLGLFLSVVFLGPDFLQNLGVQRLKDVLGSCNIDGQLNLVVFTCQDWTKIIQTSRKILTCKVCVIW